jgi:hypothetical protein
MLSRYVDLLKGWTIDEKTALGQGREGYAHGYPGERDSDIFRAG